MIGAVVALYRPEGVGAGVDDQAWVLAGRCQSAHEA